MSTQETNQPMTVAIAHSDEVTRAGLQALVASAIDVENVIGLNTWSMTPVRPDGALNLMFVAHDLVRNEAHHVQTARHHKWKIIVLLQDTTNREVSAATELNPDGFLVEGQVTAETLRTATKDVTDGHVHVPQSLMRNLLTEYRRPVSNGALGINILTPREVETLRLLADGFSNKQIATRHGISINGVKRHVGNILAKLNCPNRTLAAAEAIRRKII